MQRQVASNTARAAPLERPHAGDIGRVKEGLRHPQSALHLTLCYGENTHDNT